MARNSIGADSALFARWHGPFAWRTSVGPFSRSRGPVFAARRTVGPAGADSGPGHTGGDEVRWLRRSIDASDVVLTDVWTASLRGAEFLLSTRRDEMFKLYWIGQQD